MTDAATPPKPLEILLLEDSIFDAELLQASLEAAHLQFSFTWVKDENGFVTALRGRRFDIILSDYQLPGFSGAEALNHALASAPHTPFIFVSGVIGEENAVELLKRGATDCVIKERLQRLPAVIERAQREVRLRNAQRVAEEHLREADALYARVVDSLQDYAVILLDPSGRIRQWNRAAGLMFAQDIEDLRGETADVLFTPEDRASGLVKRELEDARTHGSAYVSRWLMRSDGTRLRGESVLTPLYSAAGEHTGYSKIVRNVTEAYNASEAMRRAKEEAERTNELKDQFLAVLSHELRSPLNAISGWSEILASRSGGDAMLSKAADVIKRNTRLQARMIDDLLDLSAVIAGKLALSIAPLDLAAIATEVTLSQLHTAQAKGVELKRAESPAITIQGDMQRLYQVITNLVTNAIKFTPAGGRICVETEVRGANAVVRVRDNGRGISAAFLPFVFDRLRQEDSSSTRRAGGLGLGLAIARALSELHHGTVTAASDGVDQGASFEILLPLPPAGDHAVPASHDNEKPPSTGATSSTDLHANRVLLVDDEADAREVGQVALTSLGAEVRLASSAQEAIDLLRQERFDVLVSDISMPGMDGLSLIREARRLPGCGEDKLAAVALTAFAMNNDRQAGIDAGFQAYVAKPIALRNLSEGIRQAQAIMRAHGG